MPIGYRLIPNRNPATGRRFYVARAVAEGTLDRHGLAELLADESGIGHAHVAGVLARLGRILLRELGAGKAVVLDGIGTLRATLDGRGVEDPGRFDARRHVVGVNVRFRPDPRLKKGLRLAGLRRAKPRRPAGGRQRRDGRGSAS